MSTDVGLQLVVVPDGYNTSTKALRLSISATPDVLALDKPLHLEDWPNQIAHYCDRLQVVVAGMSGSATAEKDDRVITAPRIVGAYPTLHQGSALFANPTWQRIFGPDLDAGMAALVTALQNQAGGPYSKPTPKPVGGAQTAELVLDQLTRAATAATFAERLASHRHGKAPGHHAINATRPGHDWWLRQYASWLGRVPRPGHPNRHASRHDVSKKVLAKPDARIALAVEASQWAAGQASCGGDLSAVKPRRFAKAGQSFLARIHDADYWRNGGGGPIPRRGAHRALAEEMHRLDLALQPCDGPPPADSDNAPDAIAARKLAGILSYPTMAKYLGLILDIEVPLKDVQAAGDLARGVIGVRLPGAAGLPVGDQVIWTTFVREPDYFGPAARNEPAAADDDALYRKGMVNLRAFTHDGSGPRFVLRADDTVLTAVAMADKAERFAAGSLANLKGPLDLPARQVRGIALIDNDRTWDEPQREMRRAFNLSRRLTNLQESDPAKRAPAIRDLEDLLVGYRFDVGVAEAESPTLPGKDRWRSLAARRVDYTKDPSLPGAADRDMVSGFLTPIDKEDVGLQHKIRRRDDGAIRPMTAVTQSKDGKPTVDYHDVLCTWHGDSLALPARREPKATGVAENAPYQAADDRDLVPLADDVDPAFDVAIRPDETRPTAPLRIGAGYWFGARAVFANGCGLELDEAIARYGAAPKSLSLGKAPDDTKPFKAGSKIPYVSYVYRRASAIRSPEVLLDFQDGLVRDAQMPPGDSVEELVVRDGGRATPRYVAPPRTAFDVAEQHGLFDGLGEKRPTGAFTTPGKLLLELNTKTGDFPVAYDRTWGATPEPPLPPLPPPPTNPPTPKPKPKPQKPPVNTRGSVMAIPDKPTRPEHPYYPDPLATRLNALLVDNGSDADFDNDRKPIVLWDGAKPQSAIVSRLELRAGAKLGTLRGRLRAHAAAPDEAPVLVAELPAGETADLVVWADADGVTLRDSHSLIHDALSDLAQQPPGVNGDEIVSWALATGEPHVVIEKVLKGGPIPLIHNWRTLKLVHAVSKPHGELGFKVDNNPHATLPGEGPKRPWLHAVVVTVDAETGRVADRGASGAPTWEKYVADQGALDPLAWPSQEGGATTFFVGGLFCQTLTTGRVRCEAHWDEHGRERYRQADDGSWSYAAANASGRLFELPPQPVDRSAPKNLVDLTRDPHKELRALSFAFPNGKARRLRLTLTSSSRFTNYFAAAELEELSTQPATDGSTVVWTPCTFRPPPPEIERVVPIFRWTKRRISRTQATLHRECGVRIYLKRSWYASGEGELLGVVLPLRPDQSPVSDVCEFDTLDHFAQAVSRWGLDPLHRSGPSDGVLKETDFDPGLSADDARKPIFKSNYDLVLAPPTTPKRTGPNDPERLAVRALGYKAQPGDEGHYVDLYIDPRKAYFPFVQLGLTRMQPHAIPGLELSVPVTQWVQTPPARDIAISYGNNGQDYVTVTVTGVGFNDAQAIIDLKKKVGAEYLDRAPTPIVQITLLEAVRADQVEGYGTHDLHWKPVLDANHKLQVFEATLSGADPTKLTWTKTIPLRYEIKGPDDQPVHLQAVLIEEFERVTTYDPPGVVDRSPYMSRIVALRYFAQGDDNPEF